MSLVGRHVVSDTPEATYEPFDLHLHLTDELGQIMRDGMQNAKGRGRGSGSGRVELSSDMAYSNSHPDWPSILKINIVLTSHTAHIEFEDQTRLLTLEPIDLDALSDSSIGMSGVIRRGNAGAPLLEFVLKHELLPSPADQMIHLVRIAERNYRDLAECVIRNGQPMLQQMLTEFIPQDKRGIHAQEWFSALQRELDLASHATSIDKASAAPRVRL